MARQVNPGSFTNAFNAERDRGTQARMLEEQRAQQAFQNERLTAADSMQRTQFENQQADRATALASNAEEQKRQSLGRVGAIAKQALTFTDPMQRKGFLQQAIPAYAGDFQAIGSDVSKLDAMLAMPDDQLLPMLNQVSAFAPGGAAYTLGKGEKRFENGREVANNPDAADGGFTLSEGQKRFDASGKPIASVDPKATTKPELFDVAAKLRSEYNMQAKDFTGVADAYQRIRDSASNPSAAGDIALLFNYLKVLDPGSTVREGEFETVASSGGLPSRVQSIYNKMVDGMLPTGVRADVMNRATTLYKGQEERFEKRVKQRYEGLARRYGLDPAEVLSSPNAGGPQSFASEQEAAAAGLKPGTPIVVNGVSGTWQ
jgi:hypothetical protein